MVLPLPLLGLFLISDANIMLFYIVAKFDDIYFVCFTTCLVKDILSNKIEYINHLKHRKISSTRKFV